MKVAGSVATVLTVLSLLLMLRTWRKEARVRTWLDGSRLVITGAAVIGMIIVLSVVGTSSTTVVGATTDVDVLAVAGACGGSLAPTSGPAPHDTATKANDSMAATHGLMPL